MAMSNEQRHDREAIAQGEERLAADPTDSAGNMRLGDLHRKRGNYVEAFTAYDAAAKHWTDMDAGPKAFFLNLQIYELLQIEAPHLASHFSHILLRLVRCYLEVLFKHDGSLVTEREEVARWAAGRGRDDDAVAALRKIADLHPDGFSSLPLTEALLRTGDVDGAIERLGIASQILVHSKGSTEDVPRSVLRLMLRRLLHVRFGAVPDALAARMNAATTKELNQWIQGLPSVGSQHG